SEREAARGGDEKRIFPADLVALEGAVQREAQRLIDRREQPVQLGLWHATASVEDEFRSRVTSWSSPLIRRCSAITPERSLGSRKPSRSTNSGYTAKRGSSVKPSSAHVVASLATCGHGASGFT